MKNLFFGGFALIVSWWITQAGLLSQTSDTLVAKQTQQDSGILSGRWYLQAVLPSDTVTGKLPTILFDTRKKTFSGHTGCNRMNGSFTYTDTSIAFNERITTTKMACPGYNEAAFLKSLLRANTYKFDGTVLILMFNATELSRWTRKVDKSPRINKT
jgi:heat shock protein HslJ